MDIKNIIDNIFAKKIDISKEDFEKIINLAKDAYYNETEEVEIKNIFLNIDGKKEEIIVDISSQFISDFDYDKLEEIYKEKFNIQDIMVGSMVRGGKVKLPFIMGSLDQLHLGGETIKWVNKYDLEKEDIIITHKLDGVSIMVIYENGKLVQGFSRGDSEYGADVTRHLIKIKNLPKRLNKAVDFKGRFEAILPKRNWDSIKYKIEKKSGIFYKNARSLVAGKMNAKESPDLFYDNVHVVLTSVYDSQLDKNKELEYAKELGFNVVEFVKEKGINLIDDNLEKIVNKSKQESLYQLDGIVIDIDKEEKRKSIPKTNSSPNLVYSVKFKVNSEENTKEAVVKTVHWNVSKDLFLKPKIEIVPIELNEVSIQYTTGFNARFIMDNGIGKGAIVDITRSGDVIPYITNIKKKVIPDMPDKEIFGSYYWNESNVDIIIEDKLNQDALLKQILEFFIGIEVPALKEANIKKLMEYNFDSIEKIIKMNLEELKEVIGDKIGEKIFLGIKEKLNPIKLANLAGSYPYLGRGLGIKKIEKIIEKYDTLDVTLDEIIDVNGFNEKTAKLFKENYDKFLAFLDAIDGYFSIDNEKINNDNDDYLGYKVIFTGVRDKELENIIVLGGGKIVETVNNETTHIICKDIESNSSKLEKARKINNKSDRKIEIMNIEQAKTFFEKNEQQYLKM